MDGEYHWVASAKICDGGAMINRIEQLQTFDVEFIRTFRLDDDCIEYWFNEKKEGVAIKQIFALSWVESVKRRKRVALEVVVDE